MNANLNISDNEIGKDRKLLIGRQNDAALMIKNGRRAPPDRLPPAPGTFLPESLPEPPEALRAARGDDDLTSERPEAGAPKGKPLPRLGPKG